MTRKEKHQMGQQTRKEIYLEYIRYFKQYGYCPGYKDIAEKIGISESTAKAHTMELIKSGLLATDHPGNSRAIRVTGYKFVKVRERTNEDGIIIS